jgi:nucleotide-binding universal stress UspA family protein
MPQPADALRRIVLATDLGADSPDLFAHALAITLRAKATLYLLHVGDETAPEATWRKLPTVRAVLERWGVLPPSATVQDFEALGVEVHAIARAPDSPSIRATVAGRISGLQPDLLVLGTHARLGLDRLIRGSVSEPVARAVHRATLFVPSGARGLVEPSSGAVGLRRVVVPVTRSVPQDKVLAELGRFLVAVGASPVSIVLVHVGKREDVPVLDLPDRVDWMFKTDLRTGAVVEQILEAELEHEADLVAMATRGHDSFLDELRGSVMERVLRRSRCPVLAVPV